jgi:uncharacterized protein (DUF983 family)
LIWRGLRLRCPNCGRGHLFRGVYATYERCAYCGWVFEREEGYWTGAMAVNLVIAELIIAGFAIPMAVVLGTTRQPVLLPVAAGIVVSILLPFLFYRHAKSLWMSLDFMLHPAER